MGIFSVSFHFKGKSKCYHGLKGGLHPYTLYVHELLLSLHQHCFLDKKTPRSTLITRHAQGADPGYERV